MATIIVPCFCQYYIIHFLGIIYSVKNSYNKGGTIVDKFVIKKPKNANRRIVIRTTDEMAEEIFSVAQQMNVSVNTFITNCIQFALNHR